jgi:hypothetical protein
VAAALAVLMVRRQWRRGAARQTATWIGFALFFFAIGGEEISWGQRLFHWKTIAIMRAINSQKEDTLHNIHGFQVFNDWLPFCLGLAGTIAILRHTRRVRDASGLPSVLLTFCLVTVLLAGYDRLTDDFYVNYNVDLIVGRLQEYVEMLVALGFALAVWLTLRRDARRRALHLNVSAIPDP